MENINKITTKLAKNIVFTLIGITVVFAGFPGISSANAAWFNSSEVVQNEPISLMEQPALFAPDRYTLTTEYRTVTSYNSEVGQCDSTPFQTAIGSQTRHGVVAANWLPIGTMVRFVDYDPNTWYVVEDRMAERFSDRTDIWMANKADSKKFGKRRLAMEIARPTLR